MWALRIGDATSKEASEDMQRRDWLLLLLALREASEALDPVRLQKGMFLLARESDLPVAESYAFDQYDYGPCSVEIYGDLNVLHGRSLVECLRAPGYTWLRYRPTAAGITAAQSILDDMDYIQRQRALFLQQVKQGVLTMSCRLLLQHVYRRYPEFCHKSVFKG
jgi:hypothetical protein